MRLANVLGLADLLAGRRYFEVDDERGIIFYFRTREAQKWDEPAKHFKLSSLL